MDFDDLRLNSSAKPEVEALLRRICDRYGLQHVAYAGSNPTSGRVYGFNTYPEEWLRRYMSEGMYRIDPTLNEARRSIAPVDWQRLDRNQDFNTVFSAAQDYGIGDIGLTVPVRGPLGDVGGLSVTGNGSPSDWEKLKPVLLRDLQSLAVHVHDRVILDDSPISQMLAVPLSTREIEILQWTASGRSQQDIGDILCISHRTVEVHLRSARTKLNALTTAQAIGRAIGRGLIHAD